MIRKLIGAVLVLQFGFMAGFDIWLLTDPNPLRGLTNYEATVFLGMFGVELAIVVYGLWLIFGKRKKASGSDGDE